MRKKEWLVLLLLLLVVGGAAYGLFSYKTETSSKLPNTLTAEKQASPTEKNEIPEGAPSVQLWVTKDFGTTVLYDQRVPLVEGETVMEVLKKHVSQVETTYNGGFVQSIQGLASAYSPSDSSSKKLDWFYSVNGVMAEIGAAEYPLHNKDVVWWDYHDWDYWMRTPGQIGAYPHPFMTRETGESIPVGVMAMQGSETHAKQIAEALSQAKGYEVKVATWDESLLEQEQAMILIGEREKMLTSSFVNKLWQERQSLGIFAELTKVGIQLYDQSGKAGLLLHDTNSSVLVSTKNPTTLLPLLVVSGNSQEALGTATSQLINLAQAEPDGLRMHYGAALDGVKIIRLPIVPASGVTP